MALSKIEAETLAKATAEVAKYYPTAIDGKTIAWVNLATCVGLTYGPRVYMIRTRLDKEKATRKAPSMAQPIDGTEAPQPPAYIPPGFTGAIGPVDSASGI